MDEAQITGITYKIKEIAARIRELREIGVFYGFKII